MVVLPRPLLPATLRGLRALADPYTPLLAQLVVTRRCNLACGYCNEYDHVSAPVPLGQLERRVDHLAGLGTLMVTMTGGEPLLHPELDAVIARVTGRGMICTGITNGYPLTRSWIERLNEAGLTLLQISLDNLEPTELSQKSWSKLRPKLELLREHARFSVNVNAVLGACAPEETRALVREVRALGFYQTVGLLHDGGGQVDSGLVDDEEFPGFYDEIHGMSRKSVFHVGERWERELLYNGSAPWLCRAGSRYLYVDEYGLVSYCSQRRGAPGIPLVEYTRADLEREWGAPKGCEEGCTIGCVRRVSSV